MGLNFRDVVLSHIKMIRWKHKRGKKKNQIKKESGSHYSFMVGLVVQSQLCNHY